MLKDGHTYIASHSYPPFGGHVYRFKEDKGGKKDGMMQNGQRNSNLDFN